MTQSGTRATGKPSQFRRWWLLPVLLIAAAGATAVYLPRWQRWSSLESLKKLDLAGARKLAETRPDDLDLKYRLGVLYGRAGQYPEAVRELVGVLQRDPVRADVLNDLGAIYLLQGRYYESLVALQGAVRAEPNLAVAWANLGRLHVATKMPFTAVGELQKAVKLDPRSVEAMCDLAEAHQKALQLSAAETVYRQALKIRPKDAIALTGLGRVLFSRAKYAEAEAAFEAVLKDNPTHSDALAALGRLLLEQAANSDQLKRSRETLRQSLKIDRSNPEPWYDLGRIALRENKGANAVELLETALRFSPDHPGAQTQLARALRMAGRAADADRVARAFRESSLLTREENQLEERFHQNPSDWDALARLVEIGLKSSQPSMALARLQQLQMGAPAHPKLPALQMAASRAVQAQRPGTAKR